jgi:hypothetical protein
MRRAELSKDNQILIVPEYSGHSCENLQLRTFNVDFYQIDLAV